MVSSSRSGRAIAQLVLVQLFIKGINFGLGVLVVRATGAKLYGVAAVPIALLLSTVLFLSREGVRRRGESRPVNPRHLHLLPDFWQPTGRLPPEFG